MFVQAIISNISVCLFRLKKFLTYNIYSLLKVILVASILIISNKVVTRWQLYLFLLEHHICVRVFDRPGHQHSISHLQGGMVSVEGIIMDCLSCTSKATNTIPPCRWEMLCWCPGLSNTLKQICSSRRNSYSCHLVTTL